MKLFNFKLFIISFFIFFVVNQAFSQQIADKDLKTNVNPLSGSLNYIERLEPVKFYYNTSKFRALNLPSGEHFGFIGEDVNQVLPALVAYKPNSYILGKNESKTAQLKVANLENYIPLLVGAIKEQQQQLEALKLEIKQLKAALVNNN